jgi:hypothetical protein
MRHAQSEPVETHIANEAAKGARIFRIKQVVVIDPASHATFYVPPDLVQKTAEGVVLYQGPQQVHLSKDAIVAPSKQYMYVFRHGTERDPDPTFRAERIK